jgi:glycerol-3-phosphate acyltransferase PlsY
MPNESIVIAAVMVGGYLLGSTPFGVISMRLAGAGDPRSIGSGNIGATNVLRSGRKDLALLTLLGDGGKGALAVLAAVLLTRSAPDATRHTLVALAAGSAFLGHLFPVFLRFKGGKGVSTSAGVLLALYWPLGLATLATWLFMALTFRYSSLSAITAALLVPVYGLYMGLPGAVMIPVALMASILLVKHAGNLRRLLAGQESKIGRKKAR